MCIPLQKKQKFKVYGYSFEGNGKQILHYH